MRYNSLSKKIFVLILSSVMVFSVFFSLIPAFAAEEEPDTSEASKETEDAASFEDFYGSEGKYIRVGLFYAGSSVTELTLKSGSGFLVFDEDMKLSGKLADTEIIITPETDYSGFTFMPDETEEDERVISINGKSYRDGCRVIERGGALRVINYVSLEHYLWGVVPKEMSSSNPIEALKAQAVCARSFALCSHKHQSYAFDVCGSSCCQVYGGINSEEEETTSACRHTGDIVIKYEGKIVPAYYSAYSGGGYTMSGGELWNSELGYLKSVRDEFTPKYTWATVYSFDEIKSRLIKAGYDDIGDVERFEITKRSENGAVLEIKVSGSKGTALVSRSNVMGVFNLKSQTFSMGESENPEIIENSLACLCAVGACGSSSLSGGLYILSGNGESFQSGINGLYVYNGETVSVVSLSESTCYTFTDEPVTGGTVYLSGLGYGHGIGMSQSGAKAMAKAGYGFEEILQYYYTDVSVEEINLQ